MAELKLGIKIPQQSIIYFALCLVGILIFIFAGLFPANRSISELDKKTMEVKYRIEEQRTLAPFYQPLQIMSEKQESGALPLPEKGKLAQSKLDTLPLNFGTAARMSGMSLITATPSPSTLTGDVQLLPVNIVLTGEFINFRKFLINIGGIPYVQHIEEITIQERTDTKEFKMKVLVAVG